MVTYRTISGKIKLEGADNWKQGPRNMRPVGWNSAHNCGSPAKSHLPGACAGSLGHSSQLWVTLPNPSSQCRCRSLRHSSGKVLKGGLPSSLRGGSCYGHGEHGSFNKGSGSHSGTTRGLGFINSPNCTQQTPQGPFLVFLTKKHQPLLLKRDKGYVHLMFTPVSPKSALSICHPSEAEAMATWDGGKGQKLPCTTEIPTI